MRRFKHLTKFDRLRIEAHLRDGKTPREIANLIGVHRNTIYLELKRGAYKARKSDWTEETRYSADLAEIKYREHLAAKGAGLKIGRDHKLAAYIERRIADDHYSPAAVLGEIKTKGLHFDTTLCVNTVYSYINKGVFLRLTNKDLPIKGSRRRVYRHVRPVKRPAKGDPIDLRPADVDARSTFGHWEMDTVVSGKNGLSALLVLTERLTRREIIRLIPDKQAATVVRALDSLEQTMGADAFRRTFRTITSDNGPEFSDVDGIERSADGSGRRTKLYKCHPYSSYERGSNENANKLIRRFLPKNTLIDLLTPERVQQVEDWINSYPRKILGFASAATLFAACMESL